MEIRDFLNYVLPNVAGCPYQVAHQAVVDAAQDFLRRTQVWREVQSSIALRQGVREYDLEHPAHGRCIDLLDVYTRAGRLHPVTLEQLADIMPTWQSAESSLPSHYTRALDFSSISIFPRPTAPGNETLTFHAVYTLSDRATAIPDDIVHRWRGPIASGAMARLMVMSKVAWQDLPLSDYHRRVFDDGIDEARINAQHDKTRGSAVVQPRRFGQ